MSRDNAGRETARNYRFQYLYGSLLAIQMCNKKLAITQLTFETDNDITASDSEGNLYSYQITRSDNLESIKKDKILESMKRFLQLNRNRKYKAFCLVANQKISDIVTKMNKMTKLDKNQIQRYIGYLGLENKRSYIDSFQKMNFFILNDMLGIQWLIDKEIIYLIGNPTAQLVECIRENLIRLVEKCSRPSEMESSEFFTETDNIKRQKNRSESSSLKSEDVLIIVNTCRGDKREEQQEEAVTRREPEQEKKATPLNDPNEELISQTIREAEHTNERISDTALILLERIGRDTRLYESRKLLLYLTRSIKNNNKVNSLNYVLDIVKRLLNTSVQIEKTDAFLKYVQKNYAKTLIKIATSTDSTYSKSNLFASQILEWYNVVPIDIRQKSYIRSLIECIKKCDETTYQKNFRRLVFNIKKDDVTISKIRKQLVEIINSSESDNVRNRCQELLDEYR